MAGDILVGSLAVVACILCFMFWKLSDETGSGYKFPLQIIIFGFILGVIILLGKASLDYKDNCSWLVNSSVTNDNTTSYSYSYNCSENTNNTQNIFYDITLWIARITTTWLFLVFAFEVIEFFAWRKKGGGR